MPILTWLDEHDHRCEAVILVAARRKAARDLAFIEAVIAESEYYGDRELRHPLYLHTTEERDALLIFE